MSTVLDSPNVRSRNLTVPELARAPICTECGDPLPERAPNAKGPPRQYCSDQCKKLRSARRLQRGSAIIEWAQTWRRNRSSGDVARKSLEQLCQILDQFNADDLAAGRPPADLAAARMLMEGTQYRDRQPYRPAVAQFATTEEA